MSGAHLEPIVFTDTSGIDEVWAKFENDLRTHSAVQIAAKGQLENFIEAMRLSFYSGAAAIVSLQWHFRADLTNFSRVQKELSVRVQGIGQLAMMMATREKSS